MVNGFFATKIETSQVFDEQGNLTVVTRLLALPLTVKQIKTSDKDSYSALCVLTRKHLKELKDPSPTFKPGDQIKLTDVFKAGDLIKVTGLSKGKGFQGVVKRHGFKGVAGQTHGQSDRQRHPGSIGMRTTPGRVWKGHRMAGRMGGSTVSIRNLKVLSFDTKTEILTVSGTVPGSRNSLVKITRN